MKVHSKEEWQALVQKLQASGLTKSEFCRRNQIANGRFYEMVKQFGGGVIPSISAVPAKNKPKKKFNKKEKNDPISSNFIEIAVEKQSSESNLTMPKSLRIVTSYGAIVEIPL